MDLDGGASVALVAPAQPGAVLLALTLMYLLSIVLLVGAELNDVLARRAGVVQRGRSIRAAAGSWRKN